MIHPQLQHGSLVLRLHLQQGKRHAQMIVQVFICLVDRGSRFQYVSYDVLHRRFPDAARNRDMRDRKVFPIGSCQLLKTAQRVIDENQPELLGQASRNFS